MDGRGARRALRRCSQTGRASRPLRAAFLYPDGNLAPLLDERGGLNAEICGWSKERRLRAVKETSVVAGVVHGGRAEAEEVERVEAQHARDAPGQLLASLGSYNLLPAIVFLPTRRRCDQAASEAAMTRRDDKAERRDARRAISKASWKSTRSSRSSSLGHNHTRRRSGASRGPNPRVEARH